MKLYFSLHKNSISYTSIVKNSILSMLKSVIALILSLSTNLLPLNAVAGKCTGSSNCTACRSCTACQHCAVEGGSCGVCGGGEASFKSGNNASSGSGSGGVSGTALLIGAGAVGAAYAIGRSSKKK